MQHIHLDNLEKLLGFLANKPKAGEKAIVLCKDFLTSDEVVFHQYIQQLSSVYIASSKISENYISNLLILHHSDLSVDIFINDFPVAIEILAKSDILAGGLVDESQIGDILRLKFPNIKIKETDNIIFCFKYRWKFCLYFDFTYQHESDELIDVERLEYKLGSCYKRMAFDYVYKTIENLPYYSELIHDGWFPYVELLGLDYRKILETYTNKVNFEVEIQTVIDKFTKDRINKITKRWWKNPLFLKKKKLIEVGINSFLTDTEEGYISTIKNLYPEIEGILGYLYFEDNDKKEYKVDSPKLLQHLKDKGLNRTKSNDSLLLPIFFTDFLQNYLFPNFDVVKNKIALSRHTSSHGVADVNSYTKIKALQSILILDQIYFFIPPQ